MDENGTDQRASGEGEGATGCLYIVSTPIGNLADFSPRAVDTLRSVSLILAEDTRHCRPLLDRYGIITRVTAYHEHNEASATPPAMARLRVGDSVALISDAGTPLLSDPGARLVRAAIEHGIRVVPVPGASAMLAALVASGIDASRFTFYGFLPRRGRDRAATIGDIIASPQTAVLYESPLRVAATLGELVAGGARDREAAVGRELTKRFENVRRGTAAELARYYRESPPRGEVVIVLAGAPTVALDENVLRGRARALREGGVAAREVVQMLIAEHGAPRNVAYRLAHEP